MHGYKSVKFVALLAIVPAIVAWTSYSSPLELGAGSRLWIAGTSTVKAFECKAAIIDAVIDDTGPGAVAAVLKGEKAVRAVKFSVPSGKLDCGNSKMNEHMLKALKASKHPMIVFKLSSYELAEAATGMQATLTGQLTLGGVTKTVTIKAEGQELAGGMLNVTGSYPIRMTEYGLTPPSLMMGAIKVGDKVQVGFQLFLKEPNAMIATIRN